MMVKFAVTIQENNLVRSEAYVCTTDDTTGTKPLNMCT